MEHVKRSVPEEVDVETGIFIDFVRRLRADPTIDQSAVERINQALLDRKEFSVEKLREALFPTEDAS